MSTVNTTVNLPKTIYSKINYVCNKITSTNKMPIEDKMYLCIKCIYLEKHTKIALVTIAML